MEVLDSRCRSRCKAPPEAASIGQEADVTPSANMNQLLERNPQEERTKAKLLEGHPDSLVAGYKCFRQHALMHVLDCGV